MFDGKTFWIGMVAIIVFGIFVAGILNATIQRGRRDWRWQQELYHGKTTETPGEPVVVYSDNVLGPLTIVVRPEVDMDE